MRYEKMDLGEHALADPLRKRFDTVPVEATSMAPAEADAPAFILKHFCYCGRPVRKDDAVS